MFLLLLLLCLLRNFQTQQKSLQVIRKISKKNKGILKTRKTKKNEPCSNYSITGRRVHCGQLHKRHLPDHKRLSQQLVRRDGGGGVRYRVAQRHGHHHHGRGRRGTQHH